MEETAKRYARWVLAVHLFLLAGAVTVVVFAAHEVYAYARAEAIERASRQQGLFAAQTARGIASHYASIHDTLELLRHAESSAAGAGQVGGEGMVSGVARDIIAAAVWQQLQNRASHFIVIDRRELRPLMTLPAGGGEIASQVIDQSSNWLRTILDSSVSPLLRLADEYVNLVGVSTPNQRLLIVAVVPIRTIDAEFLQSVHSDPRMSALMLDENMRIMTAFDKRIVGLSVIEDGSDPDLSRLARGFMNSGQAGTVVREEPFSLGAHQFNSGLISVEPLDVLNQRWWLSIGTDFSEVNSAVQEVLGRVFRWAALMTVLITGILVSTAVQMIRGRVRLERIGHEAITRELSQARKIQLAWLPKNDQDPERIDLAAVNKPASHISGDFYNWFDLPDGRTCVVIGDVTGHGMAAAFLMATTQLLVRMLMPRMLDPGKCMQEINRQLCQQVFAGQFVTMQILAIDRQNGRVDIASAGHPPPLVSADDLFSPMELRSQLVLGIEPDTEYTTQGVDLAGAAGIVLYTDGVSDAQAPDGRRFHIEGLCKCLYGKYDNAQVIADCIVGAVDAFRGPRELADDLTLVVVHLEPVASPGSLMAAR